MEIYEHSWGKDDDPNGTSVHAVFDESGNLVFTEIDFGPGAKRFTGADDMETLLIVEADEVHDFMLEVFKAAFGQRRQMTLKRLERICINAEIQFTKLNSWD